MSNLWKNNVGSETRSVVLWH